MTNKMEIDIKALGDAELAAFVTAGQAEMAARDRRRRDETIAKIRALAGAAGLSVSIAGARGRPGGSKPAARPAKAEAGSSSD